MRSLIQTISDRLRALFVADLALEFEAQLLSRQADRRAELLVQAEQHDRHGFPAVAAQLRHQAEALSLDRPLAGVLPALDHWRPDAPDIESAPATPMTHPSPTHNGTTGTGPDPVAKVPATRRRSR